MDWRRERDGLVVVGLTLLVLGLVVSGSGTGMAATFVATFLGVVAALRFESWLADDTAADESPTDDAQTTLATDDTPERAD
jgi:hypothetical protein